MGVILRQSFKGTVVGYAGAVLGALTTLYLYPKFLSREQIGLTRVLLDTAIFFSFFAQAGIPNVIIRYFPYFKDPQNQHRGFYWLITIFPLFTFFITLLIFLFLKPWFIELFAKNSSDFVQYYFLIFPLALFYMFGTIYESYSSSLQRITVPKIIRDVAVRILMIALIISFAYFHLTLDTYLYYFVSVYFLFFVLNAFNIFSITSIGKPKITAISPGFYKGVIQFMFFIILAGIGSNLVNKIDVIMISSMENLAETGVYSIAFYIAAMIEIPARSSIQISLPFVADAMKNNDFAAVENLYKKNTLNQWILAGILMVLILINLENIYKFMPRGDLYKGGELVVILMTLTKFIDVVTGINTYIISYSKYYRYSLYLILFLAGLTIFTNYIFIPIYGITGAALATLISIFINNVVVVFILYRKMNMHPFTKENLGVSLVISGCFAISYFIPTFENLYLDTIIRSTAVVVFFALAVYKFQFSPELNQLIVKFLNLKGFVNFIKGK